MSDTVTLTNERGEHLGTMNKLEAHKAPGSLHIAFSVYVFTRNQLKILIQRRSAKKMLWPMIWANTCCSHPNEDESPAEAGKRRLQEELGVSCRLTPHSSFVYRAEDPNGNGVEHEYVTMLVGEADEHDTVTPNPLEVAEYKWVSVDELRRDMKEHHDNYAPWFHMGLERILSKKA